MRIYRPELHVDLNAIRTNYCLMRDTSGAKAGAVIKADGYGLGAVPIMVALQAEGCDTFFTANLDEAIRLRESTKSAAIHVFEGYFPDRYGTYITHSIWPVFNDLDELAAWPSPIDSQFFLHIDTGMNRLGLSIGDDRNTRALQQALNAYPDLALMSHFAYADLPDSYLHKIQMDRISALCARFPERIFSLGNCAGALLGSQSAGDLIRPGIGLYGGNPFAERANPFQSVVRLIAPLLQWRDIKAGDHVGYGGLFQAKTPMRVGTVGIGYADGISRNISDKAYVMMGARRARILGRVSMDSIIIDLSDVSDTLLRKGKAVEILGQSTLDQVAKWMNTSPYELLIGFGSRIQRIYSR